MNKAYWIPIARYWGKGISGLKNLLEELEVENERVKVPSQIRWLGGADDVRSRFQEGKDRGLFGIGHVFSFRRPRIPFLMREHR